MTIVKTLITVQQTEAATAQGRGEGKVGVRGGGGGSLRKGVLRNFTNFTGKHLCQSLFFDKVEALNLQLY